ncbi:MAG: hypothetical protein HY438_03000 [DPANN group archaeon]|nr:hypothetical protein [DPANN group archaeon]
MGNSEQMSGYVLATSGELRLVRLVGDGWVMTKRVLLQKPANTHIQILEGLGVAKASVDKVVDGEVQELRARLPDLPVDAETQVWAYRGPRLNARMAEDVLTNLLRARSAVWLGPDGEYVYRAIGLAIKWPEKSG